MYTLKSIARRGTNLTAAIALAVGAVVPAIVPAGQAFADALNPLTERSLTLSSSSPGWAYTDGSGNSTYAPPNSGANGQKTGNYFSFRVSSAATVNTFSFQYCTQPAGVCNIPGNDATRGTDVPGATSDLNVDYPSATEVADGATGFDKVIDPATGSVLAVPGYTNNNPKYSGSGDPAEAAKDVTGNYIVMYNDGGTWTQSTGWTAAAHKVNDSADTGVTNNYITLTNSAGQAFTAGQQVKVLFFANDTNFITNPGNGAFFVKINTYNKEFSSTPTGGQVDLDGLAPATDDNIIDGGVTVANVMNQSIQITTKVLETMEFSVGTVDPNTLTTAQLTASENKTGAVHKPCNTILTRMTSADPQNVLQLGDQGAESSLDTSNTYATHSYWRLSSNSSAGATVYYSGHTLSNTSGDEIEPIGTTAETSAPGSEQFGLAIAATPLTGGNGFDDATTGVDYSVDPNYENGADNGVTGVDDSTLTDNGAVYDTGNSSWDYTNLNKSFHMPRLDPLVPTGNSTTGLNYYGGGSGTIGTGGTATFAFDPMSDTVPAPIASENDQVVDCVTAKMRYIANIAATTPAGIYTTKINYIAAPQY